MSVMKTIVVGALLAGSLASPVYAQNISKGPAAPDTPMQMEEKQKQRDAAEVDQQYKSTLRRTRSGGSTAAAPADDPWSNMRGDAGTKPKP